MKKLFILFLLFFTIDSFATGIGNVSSAPCDNATLNKYTGTANVEINWEPNTINLNWYDGDTKLTVANNAQSCVYDGNIAVPPQPTKPGYTFNGWKVIKVPGGYTELEYLHFDNSTANSTYLNTGITLTNNHKIKVRVNGENFLGVMGIHCGSTTSFQFYDTYYRFGSNNLKNYLYEYWNRIITLTYSQNGLYVNDTLIDIPNTVTFTACRTCLIGSIGSSDSNFVGKIYEAWIELNGNTIGHYVPARRNSDNVLGMYDSISGQFLTNQGSGNLTAGPEIN